MPISEEGVVWDKSISSPEKNIVYIFREGEHREVRVFLDDFDIETQRHNSTFLMAKEKRLLTKLKQELEI